MLVISRKIGQSVVLAIGGRAICELSIADIRQGSECRLTFEAEDLLRIWRRELWDEVKQFTGYTPVGAYRKDVNDVRIR